MLTLNSVFKTLLLEGRLEQALEKYPQHTKEIKRFAQEDPSKKLKYLAWQVKQLAKGEPANEIISLVKQFHKASKKLAKKDLFQYKSLSDLRHAFETELETESELTRKQVKKE